MSSTAYFDGQEISREEVRLWEMKRGARALRAIRSHLGDDKTLEILADVGFNKLEPENLEQSREMLAVLKARLGHDGVRAMMGSKTKRSQVGVKFVLALSRGRTSLCTIDVVADGIGAQGFLDWFMRTHESNNEAAMLAANPDHWLIYRGNDGRQEVIETVGSSPLPSYIFIDFNDETKPKLQADPQFPVQMVAAARLVDGRVAGCVRHQFRDEARGIRAKLSIEFPRFFPAPVRRAHRWHLACEFMNWIEAATRDVSGGG
jgi:hypothetical protein